MNSWFHFLMSRTGSTGSDNGFGLFFLNNLHQCNLQPALNWAQALSHVYIAFWVSNCMFLQEPKMFKNIGILKRCSPDLTTDYDFFETTNNKQDSFWFVRKTKFEIPSWIL